MTTLSPQSRNQPSNQSASATRTPASVIAGIILFSIAASALICYLVYFHAPLDVTSTHLRSLPLLNAILNACCTIALIIGFVFIRARRIPQHRAAMFRHEHIPQLQ